MTQKYKLIARLQSLLEQYHQLLRAYRPTSTPPCPVPLSPILTRGSEVLLVPTREIRMVCRNAQYYLLTKDPRLATLPHQEWVAKVALHHIILTSMDRLAWVEDIMTAMYELFDVSQTHLSAADPTKVLKSVGKPGEFYECFITRLANIIHGSAFQDKIDTVVVVFDKSTSVSKLKQRTQKDRVDGKVDGFLYPSEAVLTSDGLLFPSSYVDPYPPVVGFANPPIPPNCVVQIQSIHPPVASMPDTLPLLEFEFPGDPTLEEEVARIHNRPVATPPLGARPFCIRRFMLSRALRVQLYRCFLQLCKIETRLSHIRLILDFEDDERSPELVQVPYEIYKGVCTPKPAWSNQLGEADLRIFHWKSLLSSTHEVILSTKDQDIYVLAWLDAHRHNNDVYTNIYSPTYRTGLHCNAKMMGSLWASMPGFAEALFLILAIQGTDFSQKNWLFQSSNTDALDTAILQHVAIERRDVWANVGAFQALLNRIENEHNPETRSCNRAKINSNSMEVTWVLMMLLNFLYYWTTLDRHRLPDSMVLLPHTKQHLVEWRKHFMCGLEGSKVQAPPGWKWKIIVPPPPKPPGGICKSPHASKRKRAASKTTANVTVVNKGVGVSTPSVSGSASPDHTGRRISVLHPGSAFKKVKPNPFQWLLGSDVAALPPLPTSSPEAAPTLLGSCSPKS